MIFSLSPNYENFTKWSFNYFFFFFGHKPVNVEMEIIL